MNKKIALSLIVIFLTASILACQFSGLAPTITPAPTPTTSAALPTVAPSTNTTNTNTGDQEAELETLYQTVIPGVVTVQTSSGLGSGWVYSSDGYIVTNAHVVGNETKVEVDFNDGTKVYGNVVGTDQNSDLAAIKVDVSAGELHPLSLGNSDDLKVGQTVAAIGNPEFLTGSMTAGIVSALGRSQPSNNQVSNGTYFAAGDIIQTDALLNHGNSGGPLLNMAGQVVGVNWEIQLDTESGAPTGIGYAISINTVKRVIPELIQTGKFDYPYLGLSTQDNLPLDIINLLGLKSTTGAYVAEVVPGGPADKAGIKAGTVATSNPNFKSGGDLIIAVDGQPVQVFDDMMRYLILHKSPGDTIVLTVLRGDQKLDITITLGVRP
ncbi:MAG: trypsin-like peptidase domain-containing protein [Anaerolineales bacterium]